MKEGKKTWEYLGLAEPKEILTSYTVPIMPEEDLVEYLEKIDRFKSIKIKVNKENALGFVTKIASLTTCSLRVDGNEAWDSLDEYLEFERQIKGLNIEFIEQPFAAKDIELYQKLKSISRFPIMADESVEAQVDFDLIQSCFHGVNVKLMKAGGYKNAIRLLKEARKRGLKTMLGCMIETSLGISSAVNLYELVDYFDLDGSLLIKNDPYNLIFEKNGFLN